MNRTHVLMLFGGESSEHDVSISSARNVYAAIDNGKYDVSLCFISRDGKWWLLDEFDSQIDTTNAQRINPLLGSESFIVEPEGRIMKPDVMLPILHGKNGEDGSVQGLAQLLHIPIVGCDVTASALCMDKLASKEIVSGQSFAVAPYHVHRFSDGPADFNKLTMTLGCPMFVKPSRSGSSVGVSKVSTEQELDTALALALKHDKTVLIEQAISARELEVAVLGSPPSHRVSGVGEVIPGAEFYSYEDKYASDSRSSVKVPAEISEELSGRIQRMAEKIYVALGCSGLARIDFFLGDDGTVYFNEINTLPGFTNISMYPKLWRQSGVGYSQLIESLIEDALSNGTMR